MHFFHTCVCFLCDEFPKKLFFSECAGDFWTAGKDREGDAGSALRLGHSPFPFPHNHCSCPSPCDQTRGSCVVHSAVRGINYASCQSTGFVRLLVCKFLIYFTHIFFCFTTHTKPDTLTGGSDKHQSATKTVRMKCHPAQSKTSL